MARVTGAGADAIYGMHARWLDEVLGAGDSLFTPGTAVWTEANLDELARTFIDRPNTDSGVSYLAKLQGQVGGASPGAIQLMAELHAVHFLIIWTGAISVSKKKSIVDAILAWMPQPVQVPDGVVEVMGPGFVHPGQWVMTRRDTQITWLIRFAAAWKALPAERQRVLSGQPWELRTFALGVHAPAANSARLALLHLAHPSTFEPIVSTQHRELITTRFADVAGPDPDTDRRLLSARASLTSDWGDGFSWYDDWLLHQWLKDRKKWPAFVHWTRRFLAEPGDVPALDETGEADTAGEEALRLMWNLSGWGDGPEGASGDYLTKRAQAFIEELVMETAKTPHLGQPFAGRDDIRTALRALATQQEKPRGWHDSEWAEFRKFRGSPVELPGDQVSEIEDIEPPPPTVDYIAEAAKKLHVDRDVLDEISDLLDDKGQVVLYGPPGTGKAHLAVELAMALAEGDGDRMAIVQFHPATTYEDFFEGLRPRVTDAGQVTYQRTSGPLVAIAEKAAGHETENLTHVLVIDEINRANLPKVFGELLFLIEHRDKSARTLYRPGEPFRLPANLKIIGTMNTASRCGATKTRSGDGAGTR